MEGDNNSNNLNAPVREITKEELEQFPTLKIKAERDIAMDFAQKVYIKFDKLIKSIILFGSTAKKTNVDGSDIDIILVIDDATVRFDQKLIMWYRDELGKIIRENPYNKSLHINTVKLTTWWQDLLRGDPTLINVIRYGETLIDFGGFFNPLKILLDEGKIKPTPEAIYTCLNRAPTHILLSKQAELSAIEGYYWSMVDSSQALLMAKKVLPPSPEHIADLLKENFVDNNLMKSKFISDFKEVHELHRRVMHGEVKAISGKVLEDLEQKSQEFFDMSTKLIKEII